MAYADQIAAIKTHAAAAGAAVTPAILDVDIGPPLKLGSRGVRLYYGGETEPARMGGGMTLTSQMIGERILLVAWWVVSNLSIQEIAAVETEMYDFKHELRTRVLGDAQLGGQSTDLDMGMVETDYAVEGNTRYRFLSVEFTTDFTEYTIAP